jgi:hypothetical protein
MAKCIKGRQIMVYSLVHNDYVLRELKRIYKLNPREVKILASIDFVTKREGNTYCTVPALRGCFLSSMKDLVYRSINKLISGGFIEDINPNAGPKTIRYLVLLGSGDHVLRMYSELIGDKLVRGGENKKFKIRYGVYDNIY